MENAATEEKVIVEDEGVQTDTPVTDATATATIEKPKKQIRKKVSTFGRSFIPFNDSAGIKGILQRAIDHNIPTLLIGETGTGKTTCIRDLAHKQKKELIRVSLNGATSVEEIIGKWILKDQETVWIDGVLIDAMKKGHWIVFDEINAALPEVLFTLHSVLDDDRKILMAEKDGEIVRPIEGFRFFATMNPSVGYAGTKDMNTALMSRFGVVIQMQPLSPAREQLMLEEHGGVNATDAGLLTHAGVLMRKAWEAETITLYCSTRDLLQAAKMMEAGLDIKKALEFTIVNKGTSPDERNDIRTVLKEVADLAKESKVINYANTVKLGEKLRSMITKALQLEKDNEILKLYLQAERQKFDIMKAERDVLLTIIQQYLKPFLQAMRDKAKQNAEDKERTEESRKDWKALQDKIEERLREIENGENTVTRYDEDIKEIMQRVEKQKKELEDRFDKQIAEESKKDPTVSEGVERETDRVAYDVSR